MGAKEVKVICPFFKKEKGLEIICEGPCDGANTHLQFQKKSAKEKHMEKFCETQYEKCATQIGIMEKYK